MPFPVNVIVFAFPPKTTEPEFMVRVVNVKFVLLPKLTWPVELVVMFNGLAFIVPLNVALPDDLLMMMLPVVVKPSIN